MVLSAERKVMTQTLVAIAYVLLQVGKGGHCIHRWHRRVAHNANAKENASKEGASHSSIAQNLVKHFSFKQKLLLSLLIITITIISTFTKNNSYMIKN